MAHFQGARISSSYRSSGRVEADGRGLLVCRARLGLAMAQSSKAFWTVLEASLYAFRTCTIEPERDMSQISTATMLPKATCPARDRASCKVRHP